MPAPNEEPNFGQTQQEMVVNPTSARQEEMPDEIADEDDEDDDLPDFAQESNVPSIHVDTLVSSEI